MTIEEMSDQFDVLFNNITSNLAPGLNEYEKSLFLTKAEKEIVKNYFTANSKGNIIQLGFDDSAKRQADFSLLMKTAKCTPGTLSSSGAVLSYTFVNLNGETLVMGSVSAYIINDGLRVPYELPAGSYNFTSDSGLGAPFSTLITVDGDLITVYTNSIPDEGQIVITSSDAVIGRIDYRSRIFTFPKDVFIVVNETIEASSKPTSSMEGVTRYLLVIPLRYDEYTRLMSKPYKRPLKYQAWRLINSGTMSNDSDLVTADALANKFVEIIVGPNDTALDYSIRYVRFPKPIIVSDLDLDGLSIDGYTKRSPRCEIDPVLHEDILQRAVELAKIAWTATGLDNAQMVITAGERSE